MNEFSGFVSSTMLPHLPNAAASALFLLFCSYLASAKAECIKKFALISAAVAAVCTLFLFALSFPDFKPERLSALADGWRSLTVEGVIAAFSSAFAPAVVAIVFLAASGEGRPSTGIWGVLISLLLLSLCYLNVLLLLGEGFGAAQPYPYFSAIGTVTAGKLFARMEGFAYAAYYASAAVRVSVCISLVTLPLKKLAKRGGGFLPYLCGVLIWAVTTWWARS